MQLQEITLSTLFFIQSFALLSKVLIKKKRIKKNYFFFFGIELKL